MQSSNNYFLSDVKLIHNETVYEISQLVKTINISESIDSMFLYGEVFINDAGNHLEDWNISDENWILSFGFYSISLGSEVRVNMSIYGVKNFKKVSDTINSYSLLICSPEAIRNLDIRISKGYAGTKKAIILDILNQLKSDKYFMINDSGESTRFLAPKINPFQAINLLLLFNSTTPDYLFWESLSGFYCNSITKILTGNVSRNMFEFDTNLMTDKDYLNNPNMTSDPNIIKSYNIDKMFDILTEMNNGSRGATSYEYDLLTGKNNIYTIDPNHANNKHYIFNENSLNYSLYLQRHKILTKLDNNKWSLSCNGDYKRKCGDLVNITLLKRNTSNPGFMSSYCGNFIITRIIHTWTVASYNQYITVSR